jgi:hypothetical protein
METCLAMKVSRRVDPGGDQQILRVAALGLALRLVPREGFRLRMDQRLRTSKAARASGLGSTRRGP